MRYGTTSGKYPAAVDVGFVQEYSVAGLADGTSYCFVVQAYDRSGTKSELSTEVCGNTADAPPTDDDPVGEPPPGGDAIDDIVLYASKAVVTKGNWAAGSSTGAAGGRAMRSVDRGWSAPNAPLTAPADYFEMTFTAAANTPYTVWLRLRAASNSKWNDSVWVQFSDSMVGDRERFRIGTSNALLVNLEPCEACGTKGWGWHNNAYWLTQTATVTFASSGTHTIRVQTREDGVEIDQIVLSPSNYLLFAPGPMKGDTTILPESSTASPSPSSSPYSGTPIAIPGKIDAAYFDHGGAGLAYADTTLGNTGGVFRETDVDLQVSSLGGHNIAWTAAGEWVTYTVNVQSAGTYSVKFRVASRGGGALQIAAGAPSNSARDVAVPDTRDVQAWTSVTVPLALAAGQQTLTVRFLVGNVSLRAITLSQ